MSYTPGPWVAINSGPHWNNDKIANWTIHYGQDQEHIVDHVYEEADAHLIAAAPELLEALKNYVAKDEVAEGYGYGVGGEAMQNAIAAIAKAEGKP